MTKVADTGEIPFMTCAAHIAGVDNPIVATTNNILNLMKFTIT